MIPRSGADGNGNREQQKKLAAQLARLAELEKIPSYADLVEKGAEIRYAGMHGRKKEPAAEALSA